MGVDSGSLPGDTIACGHFSGATPPVISSRYGFNSPVVRNAKGDFTVTLTNGVDTNDRAVVATSNSPNSACYDQAGSTDTTLHFLVVDGAGSPADGNIDFICQRTATGGS